LVLVVRLLRLPGRVITAQGRFSLLFPRWVGAVGLAQPWPPILEVLAVEVAVEQVLIWAQGQRMRVLTAATQRVFVVQVEVEHLKLVRIV